MSLCITACRVQEYVVKDVERKRPPPVFGLVEGDDPASTPRTGNWRPQTRTAARAAVVVGAGPAPAPASAQCRVVSGPAMGPARAPGPPGRGAAAPASKICPRGGPSPRRPRAPAAARFQVREKKAESNSVCLFHTIHTNAQHSKSRRRRGAGSSDEHG